MTGLANCDIRNHYLVIVRNKFRSVQVISKRHTPNDEYEKFIITSLEAAAAAGCILTKSRANC